MRVMTRTLPSARRGALAGRPPARAERDVRAALLEAARDAFAAGGYHAASLRRIAGAAGVNPAMIHYYFGSKQGLYRAMLAEVLEPVIERLAGLSDADSDRCAFAERILRLYTETMREQPWLPALVARDVLAADGPARRVFVDLVGKRVGGSLLPGLIDKEMRAGHIRPDLDPRMTTLSLISLAVFPMLALPVAGPILGYGMDVESLERLVAHNAKLFEEGTRHAD